MVEQSTAASHALANGAVELARLVGPFSIAAAARVGAVRRSVPRAVAKPLRSKAFGLHAAVAGRPAGIDILEEF